MTPTLSVQERCFAIQSLSTLIAVEQAYLQQHRLAGNESGVEGCRQAVESMAAQIVAHLDQVKESCK